MKTDEEGEKECEILFTCSRCGGKYLFEEKEVFWRIKKALCNQCSKEIYKEIWIKMVDILENNFPKLNIDDVSKPSSNNRSQALVMLSELKLLFKEELTIIRQEDDKARWEEILNWAEKQKRNPQNIVENMVMDNLYNQALSDLQAYIKSKI